MSDPTIALTPKTNASNLGSEGKAKLVSAEALVVGGFVGELYGVGELQFLADEPGAWPVGRVVGPTKGTSLTGTNTNDETDVGAAFRGDEVVVGIAVTGVASYADKGKPVYATDGQTLTLTRPGDDAIACGFVWDKVRDDTTTTCDVFVFGKATSWMLASAGGNKRRIVLATLPMASIADTSKITHTLWGHGKIVEIGAQPIIDISTGSKATTLTCSINAVAITTGALALTSAGLNTPGTAQSVTPTAANEFHDGDVFNGQFGTTTTFGEGYAAFYIDVEYLPGA